MRTLQRQDETIDINSFDNLFDNIRTNDQDKERKTKDFDLLHFWHGGLGNMLTPNFFMVSK